MRATPSGLALMVLSAVAVAAAAADQPPRLSLPLACEPDVTCFVQQYVDIDPSAEARDWRCGSATYDGHSGTDFRLLSAAAARDGVPVLAVADGIVKGHRDGMADVFVTVSSRGDVDGRECGNGVVVDHGGGWETQYCHLRQGSVRVGKGQRVSRGQPLGEVGYSGLAEFAHVHLSVRHAGKTVDPFSGLRSGEACLADGSGATGLWDEAAAEAFAYSDGRLIAVGFAGQRPDVARLEQDHRLEPPTPSSPALIFYARAINLRAGDRLKLSVIGPQGFEVSTEGEPFDRNKARWSAFVGKPLRAPRWPAGHYQGTAAVVRGGNVVSTAGSELDLK